MQFKHHIARKFHESKQAPLWKWVVVIFMIVAMPLFFLIVNLMQTDQAVSVDNQLANVAPAQPPL